MNARRLRREWGRGGSVQRVRSTERGRHARTVLPHWLAGWLAKFKRGVKQFCHCDISSLRIWAVPLALREVRRFTYMCASAFCFPITAVQNERQPRNTATIRPETLREMEHGRALREAAVAVGVFG